MASLRAVLSAASLFVLLACGEISPEVGREPRDPTPGALAGGDTLYSCGGRATFPGESLEGPGDVEDQDSPLGDALRELMSGMDGVTADDGWRVVWEKGDEVLVVAPYPEGEHPYQSALFERSGKAWEPRGWGDCMPTVVIGDRSPVEWKLEEEPSDDATELDVVLEERACSGGRELSGDNIKVDIEYHEDSIAILISADPLGESFYTCPLNPSSFTIELDEPVAGRRLIDRATYPPIRRDE